MIRYLKVSRKLFMAPIVVSAVLSFLMTTSLTPLFSQDKIYWAENASGKIQSSSMDGSNVQDVVILSNESPRWIAIDPIGKKLYWMSNAPNISRSNLDGTNVEILLANSGTGLAVDGIEGKMYWTDGNRTITRANLDGSAVEEIYTPDDFTALDRLRGIAVDPFSRLVYWTIMPASPGGIHWIQRGKVDGTGTILTLYFDTGFLGFGRLSGIALDRVQNKVYWTDSGSNKIQRSDDRGSQTKPDDLITQGLIDPLDIAIDSKAGKMYWSDVGSFGGAGFISRANLDGSGIETLVTVDPGTGGSPVGIALFLESEGIAAPTADFNGALTSGTAPLTVQFTDQSTGSITSRLWEFGDGQTGTATNPSHTYQNPGSFSVKLTVTGAGGSDTRTRTNFITVGEPAPQADFTGSPTSGTVPLTVQFTDQSTGNITSRLWEFGDGQTGTASNPSHTYQTGGSYNVKLTVIGSGGSHTRTRNNYISVAFPTAVQEPTAEIIEFALGANYPNPFNPETVIRYQLAKRTEVKLEIYNLVGQKIATLVDKQQSTGEHSATWSGRDDLGRSVSSGIYIYRLQTGSLVESRKMLLLR